MKPYFELMHFRYVDGFSGYKLYFCCALLGVFSNNSTVLICYVLSTLVAYGSDTSLLYLETTHSL